MEVEILAIEATYLVYHHDGQQVANRGEEEAIQVMACTFTDLVAKDVKNDLANGEEEDPKRDIPQRPSILKRIRNKNDLHDHIDQHTDAIDQIQDDEQTDRLRRSKPNLIHKRQDRHGARNNKHGDGTRPQQPNGLLGAILVELEADETVDEQTGAQRRREAVLHRDEVRVRARGRGHDTRIQHEGDDGQEHVDVEEGGDFLAT